MLRRRLLGRPNLPVVCLFSHRVNPPWKKKKPHTAPLFWKPPVPMTAFSTGPGRTPSFTRIDGSQIKRPNSSSYTMKAPAAYGATADMPNIGFFCNGSPRFKVMRKMSGPGRCRRDFGACFATSNWSEETEPCRHFGSYQSVAFSIVDRLLAYHPR